MHSEMHMTFPCASNSNLMVRLLKSRLCQAGLLLLTKFDGIFPVLHFANNLRFAMLTNQKGYLIMELSVIFSRRHNSQLWQINDMILWFGYTYFEYFLYIYKLECNARTIMFCYVMV